MKQTMETVSDALDAFLAHGFANASPSVAGGCLHGVYLEWGGNVVYVTENEDGPGFTLGLYTADEYAYTGEAYHYENYPTVTALLTGVKHHLEVTDD